MGVVDQRHCWQSSEQVLSPKQRFAHSVAHFSVHTAALPSSHEEASGGRDDRPPDEGGSRTNGQNRAFSIVLATNSARVFCSQSVIILASSGARFTASAVVAAIARSSDGMFACGQ